jgi:hypothetical protein
VLGLLGRFSVQIFGAKEDKVIPIASTGHFSNSSAGIGNTAKLIPFNDTVNIAYINSFLWVVVDPLYALRRKQRGLESSVCLA